MYFLRPSDFNKTIDSDNLTLIINSDDSILEQAEQTAIEEMNSYLSARYKTDIIFAPYQEFQSGATYNEGERVYTLDSSGNTSGFYYSVVSGNTSTDLNDASYWIEGDNRNQLIVTYLIDMVLFHIYSRISPRNIPELRGIRYDNAIGFLNKVATGKLNVNTLPEIDGYSGDVDPLYWLKLTPLERISLWSLY